MRLEFLPAGVLVTLTCYVLPPSVRGELLMNRSDIIIGDFHLRMYGIHTYGSCKHVGVVKDYIKRTPELKPLTASVHYSLL